jgi:hypothetical protein
VSVHQLLQSGLDIYWWRRVNSIDFPYRGKVVKVGPSRITVRVVDVATDGSESGQTCQQGPGPGGRPILLKGRPD